MIGFVGKLGGQLGAHILGDKVNIKVRNEMIKSDKKQILKDEDEKLRFKLLKEIGEKYPDIKIKKGKETEVRYGGEGLNPFSKSKKIKRVLFLNKDASASAIAHELGHIEYMEGNSDDKLAKWVHKDKLQIPFRLIDSGGKFYGSLTNNIKKATITPVVTSLPELIGEYKANKYSINKIRELGASKEYLKEAKKARKLGMGTYVVDSMTHPLSNATGIIVGNKL